MVKLKRRRTVSRKARQIPSGVRAMEAKVAELEQSLADERARLQAAQLLESQGFRVIRVVSTGEERHAPKMPRKRKIARVRMVTKPVMPVLVKVRRKIAARKYGRPTWTDGVWRVMQVQPAGISYTNLLAEVAKGELGQHRSKGDKGFYAALHRMFASGDLVKIGGLVYTAKLADSLRKNGTELPTATKSNGRGGSRTIIKAVLGAHPHGLTGSQIKELAAKHADAPDSLRSESNYIYNVLGQMKKDGEITHEGNIYRVARAASSVHVVH